MELVLADDSLIDDGALPETLSPRDLVTILGNLIDNAVDAASEAATGPSHSGGVPGQRGPAAGRPVRARVTVTALADDGELLLRVADTGSGVDPGDAAQVFHRGWSTHGAGRGLGLALVQQAVHRGGGTVTLSEGPDGGAEFTVRLPLPPAATPSAPTHASKEPTP